MQSVTAAFVGVFYRLFLSSLLVIIFLAISPCVNFTGQNLDLDLWTCLGLGT